MALPVVIVATTKIAMAKALEEQLKQPCLKLGLKLKICPGALDSQVAGGEQVGAYQSSEELFDYLESCDPMILADSLVVLDVGYDLEIAFEPCASSNQESGWYCSKVSSAGIGVEILLRFPQLFPVFLSPLVKAGKPSHSTANDASTYILPMVHNEENKWKSFSSLVKKLQIINKGEDVNEVQASDDKKQEKSEASDEAALENIGLMAFETPLHFVSPVDGGTGIFSTLERFSRGMRCWFDPTGLRTLVKNRYLGMVFGSQSDWQNTKTQRELLLGRLKKTAVVIDEERKFAVFNAYSAWKYGRRTWMVTTFEEFDGNPLWACRDENDESVDVLVLRDIDLRFPDVPDKKDFRHQARDINSKEWLRQNNGAKDSCKTKIGNKWHVRAVSGEANIENIYDLCWLSSCDEQKKEKRLGQSGEDGNFQYLGFQKPIATLYDLCKVMGDKDDQAANPHSTRTAKDSVVSKTAPPKGNGDSSGGHGAPYTNLMIAESLLKQSARANGSSDAYLLGALLASEAYELLLGMSKTTAMEALLAMHKAEISAEVSFPGVSHSIEIKGRKKDIDETVKSLFFDDRSDSQKRHQIKISSDASNMFLSQFWAELRPIYRDGEQFDAAEAANVESFVNAKWPCVPEKPKILSSYFKRFVMGISTSIRHWCFLAFLFSLFMTALYCPIEDMGFFTIWGHVVLSSLGLSLTEVLYSSLESSNHFILSIVHIGFSYILFGLLISMLYRKLTRN